jgi:hypothetical protein
MAKTKAAAKEHKVSESDAIANEMEDAVFYKA